MATDKAQLAEGSAEGLNHPRVQRSLRSARLLIGCYVALSVCTLIAVVLLRDHHDIVNAAVWTRASIVVAASLLMAWFAARTARGHSRSYLRLRLSSAAMVIAIAVIVALPGAFPAWLKAEQAACGVLLLGVVLTLNGRHVRSVFTSR
ncbi:hypothetical protein ACSNOH_24390 [Streptomyces sp. URMC 127]|uniref:hypothetical protein n=1 Tax=Streptomyces sp. URMC 127 TaxID=3423402 RepID=UPI003F1BEE99